MKPTDQAIVIGQQFHSLSIPQSYLGIVSPCSSCLNQRSAISDDGKPACPRRIAAAQKQNLDANNQDSSDLALVVLTGTSDGQQDDGTMTLSNPVYEDSLNTILVWVAAFKDNGPTVDSGGNLLSPDILDPSFSSDWLQCKSRPFVPRDSEAQYFQKGCLMEGDQVEIQFSPRQQVTGQPDGDSAAIAAAGTVHKINAHGQFPRQPVSKDLCVSGT